ncbi:MAG: TetR/AcrR family transcriptional regulator [Gammaproteobacteria bacterium]|nr:TetR/AcrR family transcriptional regulator [Gammaproteobacteria bacterium]
MKRHPSQLRVVPEPTGKVTKADRTRAVILNAALEFIWSHPFRELSVNSLMASTGLSRAAFYQYFEDIHKMMETLLHMLAEEIFASANIWLEGVGDPVALLNESFQGLTQSCYQHGPFLRAVADASTTDERFEKSWGQFLSAFDDTGNARIQADQAQGLIATFDTRPVIFALNRVNAYTFIDAFGQRPRKQPKPIQEALARIWISTLYGAQYVEKGASNLIRK